MIDVGSFRKDIKYLNDKIGKEEFFSDIVEMIKVFEKDMSVIENNIYMIKNKSC